MIEPILVLNQVRARSIWLRLGAEPSTDQSPNRRHIVCMCCSGTEMSHVPTATTSYPSPADVSTQRVAAAAVPPTRDGSGTCRAGAAAGTATAADVRILCRRSSSCGGGGHTTHFHADAAVAVAAVTSD